MVPRESGHQSAGFRRSSLNGGAPGRWGLTSEASPILPLFSLVPKVRPPEEMAHAHLHLRICPSSAEVLVLREAAGYPTSEIIIVWACPTSQFECHLQMTSLHLSGHPGDSLKPLLRSMRLPCLQETCSKNLEGLGVCESSLCRSHLGFFCSLFFPDRFFLF